MTGDSLTGSRIRERRLVLGVRQADLARDVEISASYLNLIEHNRRRIGGKLLVNLARALGVEPSLLTEGVEATLIAALREAAAESGTPTAELDRVDEFAGRFPGWAEVLSSTHTRIAGLERMVRSLSDRLTHDPHLAASLHEVLSTAASIRSTAAILADPGGLEPEWQSKFTRNLNEDSQRLADSSRALVSFLDAGDSAADRRGIPQEAVEELFAQSHFHFSALEEGKQSAHQLLEEMDAQEPLAARRLAASALTQYQADARAVPLSELRQALQEMGVQPGALAQRFGVELPVILRRLALVPQDVLGQAAGLVMCDASGAMLFRKPVAGFTLPRFGSCCPLWPLFAALSRPGAPIHRVVQQAGRSAVVCDCYAVSWSTSPLEFGTDPVLRAVMLILPRVSPERSGDTDIEARPVGANCRICSQSSCSARREPSILRQEV